LVDVEIPTSVTYDASFLSSIAAAC
jgi:hypothetical protein